MRRDWTVPICVGLLVGLAFVLVLTAVLSCELRPLYGNDSRVRNAIQSQKK